ncbi:superoxide dismutase family protein [Virgibacillus halophilus]|uniref:Superoxide dismutase family protein n=1 Tax=Tigheibacillus halophilus TaxID=361280 RepID=A0ABU5C4J7_9BACI|nr:superoxide dismutase family protein [Virgibacillus halophilus]
MSLKTKKKDKEASDNTLEDQQKADDQLEVKLKDSDKKPVGTVTLKEKQDGVEVVLDGHDLPKGTHAFHIHEKGMCEAPDYESAGGHFNPDNMKHGFDQKRRTTCWRFAEHCCG